MKKILHIQLLPLLSVPQNVMLHILAALNQNEYEIDVASKPGGPMVDEDTGWLIAPNQPETLEVELHLILNEKDTYEQKGLSGRTKVNRICSYNNFIDGYKSIYAGEL